MRTLAMRLASGTALGLAAAAMAVPLSAQETDSVVLETVVLTAEEQAKQALGVSQITEEDLERQPVVNDVAEIIRKQPGVNLTGATATGQRGNQRQIDIRGMGPENTLILIDGKPVLSRNSVKMSRGGERDTRGDSNGVPAELIESIEVIRGPAAARYGSGASGGVVNIITKRPDSFTGQVTTHYNLPESSDEGDTARANFMLAGPAGERMSFRLFGSYNKTDPDSTDINAVEVIDEDTGLPVVQELAGREGVVNKDGGALLTWQAAPGHEVDFEVNVSRQGNRFAGDTRNGAVQEDVGDVNLIGDETNRMYRRAYAITHRGEYAFGESRSFIQWENTHNTRLCAGLAGSSEDNITNCVDTDGDGTNDATEYQTIKLDTVTAKSEWIMPMDLGGKASKLTFGAEYRGEFMEDAASIRNALPPELGGDTGVPPDPSDRDPEIDQQTIGLYAEANIEWNDRLTLTPGLRLDHGDRFASAVSPSLNVTYATSDAWTMKLGVARAFKTPNLYQLNPNYVYSTNGNGCPFPYYRQGPCYILGNPDLEPERSLNKEIGIAYEGANGVAGSLTWFHNDYDNRIAAGLEQINGDVVPRLYRWENQGEAVISGIEGNFSTDLGERFALNANLTKMIKSEKKNGEPLSLIPDYTVNASLDWYAGDAVTVTLSATVYGEIDAATLNSSTGYELDETNDRPSYSVVNLGAVWDVTEQARVSAGITNLFDERVLRTDTNTGANTFNEPGRAFYLTLSQSF